ncbi:hypothetical protein Agub_g11174, partial [Astrephomene gubernaculifera]
VALLPELALTDSSEALLTGRKPPFRLLVSPLPADVGAEDVGAMEADMGAALQQHQQQQQRVLAGACSYAVSEEFVVATRRVKHANKAATPLLEEPVGRLEHIGRETVRKLADLG